MRLLVCGGRDFSNAAAVNTLLAEWHRRRAISCLIHGAARGADTLAGAWAESAAVPVETYPADWEGYGRGAGPIRNARMLAEGRPAAVLAFPGGRGTADMVTRAKAAGVPVAFAVIVGDTWRIVRHTASTSP